jgi:hypothetical protein
MLKFLELDHIAINVKDKMDEAYSLFSEIGFQLSPRGYHSLGSINHSMVFENNYLELIGHPKGKPIKRPELKNADIGINGLVFKSNNVENTYNHLLSINYNDAPPRKFDRPVLIKEIEQKAVFETVSVNANVFKAGRVYFCNHITPQFVWLSSYQNHENYVSDIKEISIIDKNPEDIKDRIQKISDVNIVQIDNKHLLIETKDITIRVLDIKNFREHFRILGDEIILRESMYGSLKLQLKSLDFLRKMNIKKIKNISKIEIGDKVQLLLKDYNLILEFEEL